MSVPSSPKASHGDEVIFPKLCSSKNAVSFVSFIPSLLINSVFAITKNKSATPPFTTHDFSPFIIYKIFKYSRDLTYYTRIPKKFTHDFLSFTSVAFVLNLQGSVKLSSNIQNADKLLPEINCGKYFFF